MKKLEFSINESSAENLRNLQLKSQTATSIQGQIKNSKDISDIITTTIMSEDSEENDYGDPDIDDGLKFSCIAALCAGK